jgi:hypothetical protein
VLEQLKVEQAAAAARKDGEARMAALKQNPADTLGQSLLVSRAIQGQPRQVVEAALRRAGQGRRRWWGWTWVPKAMPC